MSESRDIGRWTSSSDHPTANQRELADALGIREATLTHHLNAMETDGLLTRRRDPNNRRIHIVELTDAGEAAFLTLGTAAVAFDQRLRRGITVAELPNLEGLLAQLAANVEPNKARAASWAGLVKQPS